MFRCRSWVAGVFRAWPKRLLGGLGACGLMSCAPLASGAELPEYQLKAAFLYNFALFTEWPVEVGSTLNLCIVGQDPFGSEVDALQGKTVGARKIVVQRTAGRESLGGCQIVFIAASAMSGLQRVLEAARANPVLTVADIPEAARQGVAINMTLGQSKVSFEVNLKAARGARLNLSSKLLRLATEVYQ